MPTFPLLIFLFIYTSPIHPEIGSTDDNRNFHYDGTKCLQKRINSTKDSITGDFDGNGKQEFAWVEAFKPGSTEKCTDQCSYRIKFSDNNLSPVILESDFYGGHLINQGDLDGIPGDEFSIVLYGDASEWSVCRVYSYRKNKWMQLVKGFNVFGAHGDYVKKDPGKKGYVIITEFVSDKTKGIIPYERLVKLFR